MRKNSKTYRNRWSVFGTIFLTVCLLFSGCTSQPDEQLKSQTVDTTNSTEAPEAIQADEIESSAVTSDDSSLLIFRQAMVETPQLFAVAFFGNVPQDSDPFAVMQEAAPQLCEDLPFLLTIDRDHILGVEGQLFCIVPADENTTVVVNRRIWNTAAESYEEPEVLYRSESGSPILVMCPGDDRISDIEVIFTDSSGNVTIWSPYIDSSCRILSLYNDNGESLIFDFTSYDELPNQG